MGSVDVSSGGEQSGRRFRRLTRIFTLLCVLGTGVAIGGALVHESFTSAFQSWFFGRLNDDITFAATTGSSLDTAYPKHGPYDRRLGYTRIPEFRSRLEARGYEVKEYAFQSPALRRLIDLGIAPPYREKARPGLAIHDQRGIPLYDGSRDDFLFGGVEEIPALLAGTLLFLENRELVDPFVPTSNPTFDWSRLAKGTFSYASSYLGFPVRVAGGSTLAIQLEKFRHSPSGLTITPVEKLRQATAASLKAYRWGADTGARRREILLDYMNSVPLAGVPGYGEVLGVGEGLHAWFGLGLEEVKRSLESPWLSPDKVRAFKYSLALLVSLPAPDFYLRHERQALNERVNYHARLLSREGIIDTEFERAVLRAPLEFRRSKPRSKALIRAAPDATNAVRRTLLRDLGIQSFYDLDRLDIAVETTVDSALQEEITEILERLREPEFIEANGLNSKRLLRGVDPREVTYSLLLFERTARGNALRVNTDSSDEAFDLNRDAKLEFGSTAKLRAIAHYLELVASLYYEWSSLKPETIVSKVKSTDDPITRWAAQTLARQPDMGLKTLLEQSLERRYSTSPGTFFTGGSNHTFQNFDPSENGKRLSVRNALRVSNNLAFVRLMRDLVRYHEARLPYEPKSLLADREHPERRRLLRQIAQQRGEADLRYAYQKFRNLPQAALIEKLLRSRSQSLRHLTILFFAWDRGTRPEDLAAWLNRWVAEDVTPDQVAKMWRAYSNPRLNLADYAYLLSRSPLQVHVAGELFADPSRSLERILSSSDSAIEVSSRWLFQKRNRRAQNTRLRIRFEQDAFARMTPYWKRLGFPFERLVPSYGTVLGSSADSPEALAELMGIILNDGMRRPSLTINSIHFGRGTPYEMLMTPRLTPDMRVTERAVAEVLREVLAEVVENGTAKRIREVFADGDGNSVRIGGKTGSGDNRRKRYNRWGELKSAKAVNRTATFVFYIGDRYFGVINALVRGRKAEGYGFTSALPLTVLKLLAPTFQRHMNGSSHSKAGRTARNARPEYKGDFGRL